LAPCKHTCGQGTIHEGERVGFSARSDRLVEQGSAADLPATEVLEVDLILMSGTLSNMGKQPII